MRVLKARLHVTPRVIVDPLQCFAIEVSLIIDHTCEVMRIYLMPIRDACFGQKQAVHACSLHTWMLCLFEKVWF